jgi:hypothetical protein
MRHDATTHDVVLACGNDLKRKFRIYGRSMPGHGDTIVLPVDGRLISARVAVRPEEPKMKRSIDAELVALVE